MPRGNYTSRLTLEDILELFDNGAYTANLDTGKIFSGRTNAKVFVYAGSRTGYLWCRLYKSPKMRCLGVSNLIWMLGTRSVIPPGFEIHHDDEDIYNNAFDNLICVHKIDHDKIHAKRKEIAF